MADGRRISFEEDLAESIRSMDFEPTRRSLDLSPVNEEEVYPQDASRQDERERHGLSGGINTSSSSAGANRPFTQRRVTDPITPISTALHLRPTATGAAGRSRTRSPYSRSHLRSRSNTSLSHPMTRAYSSPLSESVPELLPSSAASSQSSSRPESPMGMSFGRRASPRRHLDEPFVYNPIDVATPSVPTIEENVELSLPSPSSTIPEDGVAVPLSPFSHSSFSRPARRRPSSPLLHSAAPRNHSPSARVLHTSSSVPTLSMSRSVSNPINTSIPLTPTSMSAMASPASRYNESYPTSPIPGRSSSASQIMSSASSMYSLSVGSSIYSGNSMPGTPTSMRSRSPSISSLDTIPDSPDAEAEAIEQEKVDRSERLERLEKLRSMVGNRESEELGKRMLGGGGGATAKERKRWSVCGAERRGDLEMETIWED